MINKRKNGVLLHISSLPSKFGIGDFGSDAYHFVDLLAENGVCVWQILPLGPNGPGNSPYQAYSAFGGDLLYISPNELVKWGLLSKKDVENYPDLPDNVVDFKVVTSYKIDLLLKAQQNFEKGDYFDLKDEFGSFLNEHNWWLEDFALYEAIKHNYNGIRWNLWSDDIRFRKPDALEQAKIEFKPQYDFQRFVQFLFFKQWFNLKNYVNSKGISILGDLPLYVSHDSSDVWSNQHLFRLDENGEPYVVGGVPPDYFSEEGQLWGNPLFNWDALRNQGYHWWIARIHFNLHMFDSVRIDHFRGLEAYWSVPAKAKTAKEGEWVKAYGDEMLSILNEQLDSIPVVAENLGTITPEVENLRQKYNLPGMKVLHFAFSSDEKNEHLPHNVAPDEVLYTGTHDNNTTKGWWNALLREEKASVMRYIDGYHGAVSKRLMILAWSSVANLTIVPFQDIINLGENARINIPGTATGNWRWRLSWKKVQKQDLAFLKRINEIYNRRL